MCSYFGCEESEIIDRSRAEHAEIVNAPVELRRAVHDGDQASVGRATDALAGAGTGHP